MLIRFSTYPYHSKSLRFRKSLITVSVVDGFEQLFCSTASVPVIPAAILG